MAKELSKPSTVLATILGTTLVLSVFIGGGAGASHEPANKTSAAGSTAQVIQPSGTAVLLSERVKTSKPTDLILGVTAECAITTELTTVGSDKENAFGQIRVWVEIDGKPVRVSADDAGGGKVVFCNRFEERETSLFDDQDATIRSLQRTRTANGFNWMALNVGSATHLITVKAEFVTDATSGATALAAVGNRTLIVEPVKSANDEAVTTLA